MFKPGIVADVRYYNGVIAKPFKGECTFNDTLTGLILTIEEDGVLQIPFSDLTIKRREKLYLVLSINSQNSRIVEINDPAFIHAFFQFNKSGSYENWHYKILHAGTAVHLALAAGILAFCAATYFYFIPFLA